MFWMTTQNNVKNSDNEKKYHETIALVVINVPRRCPPCKLPKTTNANSTRFQYKVALLGDVGVGKTSLIDRFCFNDFIMDTQETIGSRFYSMTILAIQDGNTFVIGLSVWDFAGQERFLFILPQFITGANAALLAFDLTRLHLWKI